LVQGLTFKPVIAQLCSGNAILEHVVFYIDVTEPQQVTAVNVFKKESCMIAF
jgi:hypothetical protein